MANRVGTTQTGGGGTSTSRAWSHTLEGSANRALTIVLYFGDSDAAVSAITVDSEDVSSHLVLSATHVSNPHGFLVYVVPGLATGERAIEVTYAGSCENWYVSEESEDVHQTTPVRDADFVEDERDPEAGTFGVIIDSDEDDLVQVFAAYNGSDEAMAPTAPQTSRYYDMTSDNKAFSDKAGTSPTTAGSYDFAGGSGNALVVGAISLQSPVAPADTLTVDTQPTTGTSGVALDPIVIESSDEEFTGDVTLSLATGSGSLSGTLTVAAVAGVATFSNVIITGTGEHTLAAAATDHSDATTAAITISAPSPALTEFEVTEESGAALGDFRVGTAKNVRIRALDQFGEVFTAFEDTVDLSATGSTLSAGSGTTAAFTAGVLVHEVEFNQLAEGVEIEVEDTDTGLVGGSSAPFDVTLPPSGGAGASRAFGPSPFIG